MNPIANLPATQNLNKAQQSQGYNRQYFGGDEVDEVVLSNQEEQKKKKALTIGGAILGAIALIGGGIFGANYFGYMGKDAKHLKGFKTLTTKNGDTTQELASIAKTTKAWTGASWGGVAETIKTTLDGKNDTKFKKIVLVASEDSQKALKESLGEDLFKKLTVIQANSDKIEDAVKQAAVHGKDKDNLIITDSSIDNLYDEIEKAIAPSDNSEKTKDAKEEKKAEKEQKTTEASNAPETENKKEATKAEETENKEEAKIEKKDETLANTQYKITSIEDAGAVLRTLNETITTADNEKEKYKTKTTDNIVKLKTISEIENEINKFNMSHKEYVSLKSTIDLLATYCQEETQKFEKDNNQIQQKLDTNYTDEVLSEKLNKLPKGENAIIFKTEFVDKKRKLTEKQEENTAKIKQLEEISERLEQIKDNKNHPFWNTYFVNKKAIKDLVYNEECRDNSTGKHKIILPLIGDYNTAVNEIATKQKELETLQQDLKKLNKNPNNKATKKAISDKNTQIKAKEQEVSEALSKKETTIANIKKLQTHLMDLKNLFRADTQDTARKKAEKQKLNEQNADERFEASIKFDELPLPTIPV